MVRFFFSRQKTPTRLAVLLVALVAVASVTQQTALASSPQLTLILPRGIQRGHEHVLTFTGARLTDAEEVFFYRTGVTAKSLEVVNDKQVKVTVVVDPNCELGEHVAQLRTKSGVSEFRTFFIGALGAVPEAEPNSIFEEPQTVATNVTVEGTVQSEDVDYFVVEAKKGDRLSAEVEGIRLGAMFDPYVAILDAKRFELAAADDSPLVQQDSIASIVIPEDGKYTIEVRESSYGGNGNCRYRLHVGNFPRPTAVYPSGGKLGEKVDVTFYGDPTGQLKQSFELPSEQRAKFGLFASDDHGISPSATPFRLFEHGNDLETEPNNTVATATPGTLPNAFNGIISEPGDVDFFKFSAKKNQSFDIECFARRLRTGLDPVMNVYDVKSKSIVGNDDSRGPDSYVRFKAPADGEYVVRVTDHLKRGQPDYVYRIEMTTPTPKLTLGIPRLARYSQYRQAIFVPRGGKFATIISATRGNFSGEIALDDSQLPDGVTMIAPPMASNLTTMPVVFEASPEAPLGGKLVEFRGRLVDAEREISGHYVNRSDVVLGQPNNSLYYYLDVAKIPIVVVEELPFTLEIVQPKAPLVRNGSINLKIVAHRKEGFKEAIRIEFPFRPPGVGTNSSKTIPAGKNEVIYPLNANASAQIKDWPIYAIGSANVGGSAWVASQMATLTVAQPFVTAELQRGSVEQGQETKMLATINQIEEFSGEAKAELLGLPAKVTAEPIMLSKATEELVFDIKTDATSPAGKHKNVFVRITVQEQGEPVVARAGTSELQIDKPLPKPKPKTTPTPKPKVVVAKTEPAKKPTEKPLTRLQKLRLAAKQGQQLEEDEEE